MSQSEFLFHLGPTIASNCAGSELEVLHFPSNVFYLHLLRYWQFLRFNGLYYPLKYLLMPLSYISKVLKIVLTYKVSYEMKTVKRERKRRFSLK